MRSLSDIDSSGFCSRYCKTVLISQVEEYFGSDGLLLNAPFINLATNGWDPKVTAEGSKITVDKALLAVFNAL